MRGLYIVRAVRGEDVQDAHDLGAAENLWFEDSDVLIGCYRQEQALGYVAYELEDYSEDPADAGLQAVEMKMLVVRPECRGLHVGTALMLYAVRQLDREANVVVTLMEAVTALVPWYGRFGFFQSEPFDSPTTEMERVTPAFRRSKIGLPQRLLRKCAYSSDELFERVMEMSEPNQSVNAFWERVRGEMPGIYGESVRVRKRMMSMWREFQEFLAEQS